MVKQIVIVSDGIYPYSTGGSHRYVYELVKVLSSKNMVTVIVPEIMEQAEIATPNLKKSLIEKATSKYSLLRFRYKSKSALAKFFSYLYNFKRLILSNAINSKAHINIQYLPALLSVILSHGYRISYFFHGPWSLEYFWNLKGRIRSNSTFTKLILYLCIYIILPFLYFIEFLALRRPDIYFVTSLYMKNILVKYFRVKKEKITILGAGVDIAQFPTKEKKNSQILELITIRRLEQRMGLEILLEACVILKEEGNNFRLRIGGKGPMRKILENKIYESSLQNYVELMGFVPEEDLSSVLNSANLFILPSVALEGFGLVILEAFACKLPVISFDKGGPPEVLKKLSDQFIVPEMTSECLAQVIKQVSASEKLKKLNLRDYVIKNHPWEQVGEKFIDVVS